MDAMPGSTSFIPVCVCVAVPVSKNIISLYYLEAATNPTPCTDLGNSSLFVLGHAIAIPPPAITMPVTRAVVCSDIQ